MAIDFDADLDELLSTDDFGSVVVYGGQTFSGILSKEYYEEDAEFQPTATTEPMLYVKTSEFPTVSHGEALTVDGDNYVVQAVETQDDGMIMLRLSDG